MIPLSANPASSTPLQPNAWHAFGGIWLMTSRGYLSSRSILSLLLGSALIALLAYASTAAGDRGDFLRWIGHPYLAYLLPTLAFVSGANALRSDLKPGAVDYLFTRPVRRPLYLAGRFVAHLACTQLGYLLMLGAVLGVGVARQIPSLAAALPLILLAQALTLCCFVALGFFLAALTSRYLVVGLIYGAIVEVGIGQIPTQLNLLSMTQQARSLLEPLTSESSGIFAADPGFGAVVMLSYTTLLMLGAAMLFGRRELAGARSSES